MVYYLSMVDIEREESSLEEFMRDVMIRRTKFSKLITVVTSTWSFFHRLPMCTHFQKMNQTRQHLSSVHPHLNILQNAGGQYSNFPGHTTFLTVVAPWAQVRPVYFQTFHEKPMGQDIHLRQQTPYQPVKYFHSSHSVSKSRSPRGSKVAKTMSRRASNVCEVIRNEILTKIGGPFKEENVSELARTKNGQRKNKENEMFHGVKRHPECTIRSPDLKKSRSEMKLKKWKSPFIQQPLQASPKTFDFARAADVIWQYYHQNQQLKATYVSKIKLRDALYDVMKDAFPYCGLYVIGSSMNGFGSCSSDMDLCLMLSHAEIDQRHEATDILRILHKSLSSCNFLEGLKLIQAKVPILKFTDKFSSIECDLNINNSVGIRNTHLMNAYSAMDCRISALVIFVKHWAKVQNINDASQGTISSYSLVLMVLHYLQCGCIPAVIPSLQQKYPHKFDGKVDVRILTLNEKLAPYDSPNQQGLGELFFGFLNYYANVFNFHTQVISVRLGRTISHGAICQTQTAQSRSCTHQWRRLCIEEPFNLTNTAYSVFDQSTFEHILNVIRQSYVVMCQRGSIEPIITKRLCV